MLEGVMRTTVTLDEQLVSEVMKVTSAKTKTKAVTIALKELVKRKKIEKLRSLLGSIDIDEKEIRKLREMEIQEAENSRD